MTKKFEEIKKMDENSREKMIDELRIELVKAKASSGKSSGRIKGIKKTIARLLTIKKTNKK